jgi:tetraacyldisaccharide 4'-kinase
MSLRADVARSLEAGRGGLASALVSRAWGATSRVARPLTFPRGTKVVAIGGATLGGSGKTPLAVACAKELARAGRSVALVGHAYGARPRYARVVSSDDDVDVVGDEALACARELDAAGIHVVIAPTRQAAIDLAATLAPVLVIDGVAQLRPIRAHMALLALDGVRPWGAGECPPRGDLRASKPTLLAACDRVVRVGGAAPSLDGAFVLSDGARLGSLLLTWKDLRPKRVGLWTALARPDRILDRLRGAGIVPSVVAAHADHGRPSPTSTARSIELARRAGVDLWLTTSKCATRMREGLGGLPLAVLAYELSLGESLASALLRAVG